jgi:hypothetical protein
MLFRTSTTMFEENISSQQLTRLKKAAFRWEAAWLTRGDQKLERHVRGQMPCADAERLRWHELARADADPEEDHCLPITDPLS